MAPRSDLLPIAAAALAAVAAPALAQIDAVEDKLARIEQAYDRCMAKAVTNPDYSACGGDLTGAEDALLNETWRAVYGAMEGDAKAALLEEQRAWNAYKEKSCLWWMDGQGREGQVIHLPRCRAGVIRDRIRDLTALRGQL